METVYAMFLTLNGTNKVFYYQKLNENVITNFSPLQNTINMKKYKRCNCVL